MLGVVAEGVGAVLGVVDFAHQAGMGDGDVVALEVVIDVDLPVAVDDVVAAFDQVEAIELEGPRLLGDVAEARGERLSSGIEIDEDESFPGFEAKREHAHGAAIEEFDAFDIGSADEAAVEGVGPAVVLAAEDIFAAAAEGDRSGSVTANVAEGAQRALLITDDEDGFSGDFGSEVGFGIGDRVVCAAGFTAWLIERADHLPGFAEDFGFFDFEDGRIGVEAGGERVGALDLFVDAEAEGLRGHREISSHGR